MHPRLTSRQVAKELRMVQPYPLNSGEFQTSARGSVHSLTWPLIRVAVFIAVLACASILAVQNYHTEQQSTRLEGFSKARAAHIGAWLAHKTEQARLAGSGSLSELFLEWQQEQGPALEDKLRQGLTSLQQVSGAHTAMVIGPKGDLLVAESAQPVGSASELKAAVRRTVDTGTVQFTAPYGRHGIAPAPRIDVVSPLQLSGSPPAGLIVLRFDAGEFTSAAWKEWPQRSHTATSLLLRREGSMLVGPYAGVSAPLSSPDLLAAKVLRGDAPLGIALEAQDFTGQTVLGVVQAVPGTDWFLASKMDIGEAFADAQRHAAAIVAAALLVFFAAGTGMHWCRERLYVEGVAAQRALELDAKNQSLERTISDLDAFSANISRELRGPLRTVNSFASILERSEGEPLSTDGKLGRILAGATAMNRMIEDVLACSRADRVEMDFSLVDLNHLVRELLLEIAPSYPATRTSVDVLPLVRADVTMTRQILAHLIGNAFKFSSWQRQPCVEIGTLCDTAPKMLFVRDNGVGFASDQAERIFQPFQSLHSGENFPGTGVGLSIVKRLVERHGGTIRAESIPGERTTFLFDFGPGSASSPSG